MCWVTTFIYVILGLAVLLLLFWRFVFLRNPGRKIPFGNNIVSPADGRIARIIQLKNIGRLNIDKGIAGRVRAVCSDVGRNVVLVQIVMNVFNVHYQRAPIAGTAAKINYQRGRFENAVNNAASLRAIRNEKNEILIKGKITVKVIQIAGVLARRIRCFVKENEKINKGQLIGLINLGSQVALIMSDKVKLRVREGQKVKAGKTIIGDVR